MKTNSPLRVIFAFLLTILTLAGTECWADPPLLKAAYRGDDGSALYVTEADGIIYGFAEHPKRKFAVVITGSRNGDRIAARFWGIPKGSFTDFGAVELQVSQGGSRLVRKSGGATLGIDVWEPIDITSIPWTAPEAAYFQKTDLTDLDGAFVGDDSSRHYVRELKGDVVWVAEAAAQPSERWPWVTVFVGKRDSNGVVSGSYADIPKGIAKQAGDFATTQANDTRRLSISQNGVLRTRRLEPDYAVDFDTFSTAINRALSGRFVGYGYAITQKGAVLRKHAAGFRRLQQDGGKLSFDPDTSSQAASFSKFFTAVDLAQALRQKNLKFNDRIAPFLPKCWSLGKGMNTMTFADLASHHSGLDDDDLKSQLSTTHPAQPYKWIRGTIEIGRTKPKPANFDYQNSNYAVMRYLVPAVVNPKGFNQIFATKDCNKDGEEINAAVSALFVDFQASKVLKDPLGRFTVEATYAPQGNFALLYDVNDQTKKGVPPNSKANLLGGAGYLSVSAVDAAVFLSNFDKGELVPLDWVESMKINRFGFDSWVNGKAGKYYWKNGGCPKVNGGISCASWGMIFPSGVQAYVVVNSSGIPSGQSLGNILSTSYEKALR